MAVALFRGVPPGARAALREAAISGSLGDAALADADLVVSMFQLRVAASTALHRQAQGCMKTHGVGSEVIFNLSPSKKISEAFSKFGVSSRTENLLVALLDTSSGGSSEEGGSDFYSEPMERLRVLVSADGVAAEEFWARTTAWMRAKKMHTVQGFE